MESQRTITRRLASALDSLEDEFSGLYTKRAVTLRQKALEKATESMRPSALKKLLDLYDRLGISYLPDQSNDYYLHLTDTYAFELETFEDVEASMLNSLYRRFQTYATPSEYLKRDVDRLSFPEDAAWKDDSLRVRILRQFVKYGGFPKSAGFGGKNYLQSCVREKSGNPRTTLENGADFLDDDIFEPLATADRPDLKPKGKYGLLRKIDDLARGRFRVQGVTVQMLYYFAIVYNMSYFTNNQADFEILDHDSDIEINLFRDYYDNNLTRFLSESMTNRAGGLECVPTGRGINYKNFAEMVYLYYLRQNDLSPAQKIERAEQMIDSIRSEKSKSGKSVKAMETPTQQYRNYVRQSPLASNLEGQDALSWSEEDFKAFLLENYDCDIYALTDTRRTPTVMELAQEQRSARAQYQAILDQLNARGVDAQTCKGGLWFTDVRSMQKEGIGLLEEKLGLAGEDVKQFARLLINANNLVSSIGKDGKQFRKQEENLLPEVLLEALNPSDTEEEPDAEDPMQIWTDFVARVRNQCADQNLDDKEILNLARVLARDNGITVPETLPKAAVQNGKANRLASLKKQADSQKQAEASNTQEAEPKPDPRSVPQLMAMSRTVLLSAFYYLFNDLHAVDSPDMWACYEDLFKAFKQQADPYLIAAGYQPVSGKNLFDVLLTFSSYASLIL